MKNRKGQKPQVLTCKCAKSDSCHAEIHDDEECEQCHLPIKYTKGKLVKESLNEFIGTPEGYLYAFSGEEPWHYGQPSREEYAGDDYGISILDVHMSTREISEDEWYEEISGPDEDEFRESLPITGKIRVEFDTEMEGEGPESIKNIFSYRFRLRFCSTQKM